MAAGTHDTNGDRGTGIDELLNDLGKLFGDKHLIALSRTALTALYRRQPGRKNSHLGARRAEEFQEKSAARGWIVVPSLRQVGTHDRFLVFRPEA